MLGYLGLGRRCCRIVWIGGLYIVDVVVGIYGVWFCISCFVLFIEDIHTMFFTSLDS